MKHPVRSAPNRKRSGYPAIAAVRPVYKYGQCLPSFCEAEAVRFIVIRLPHPIMPRQTYEAYGHMYVPIRHSYYGARLSSPSHLYSVGALLIPSQNTHSRPHDGHRKTSVDSFQLAL